MGFKDFGSERLLSTDVDNLLMKQANIRTTFGAEPTGEEGMEVHYTDKDRAAISNGSAWIRTAWWSSAGRTGATLTRSAVQSITSGIETVVLFDTETQDTDGFYPGSGGTITIPAGLGGLYIVSAKVNFGSGAGALGGSVGLFKGGGEFAKNAIPANASIGTVAGIEPMAPTNTVTFRVMHANGSPNDCTAVINLWRMGA